MLDMEKLEILAQNSPWIPFKEAPFWLALVIAIIISAIILKPRKTTWKISDKQRKPKQKETKN